MQVAMGILIPFIGTTLGAAMVFLMKKEINRKIEKLLLGFASGVMIAASVWSLIMPSIEMAKEQNQIAWLPASVGFLMGIIFLLALDYIIQKIKKEEQEKPKSKSMMVLAVTLHNIPEGMAVRSGICWSNNRKYRNNNRRGNSISSWNCNTKLSRGSNYFNAIKK